MTNYFKDKMAKLIRKFSYYEIWSDSLVITRPCGAKVIDTASHLVKQVSCSCASCPWTRKTDGGVGECVVSQPTGLRLPKLRDVQQLLERKKQDLYSFVGEKRGRSLYEDHVQQWDYVLIYAHADCQRGLEVRAALQKSREDVAVSGPWCIRLGDSILNAWERLLRSATVVVVLVSKELYRERILNLCFPEMLSGDRMTRVVPMFLEDLDENEMACELRPIKWRQGLVLSRNGVEAAVRELARHTTAQHRYLREVVNMDSLLQNLALCSRASAEPVEVPEEGDCFPRAS